MRITIIMLLLIFFGGCIGNSDTVVEHPTAENLDMSGQKHSAILFLNDGTPQEDSDFGSIHPFLELEKVDEISKIGIQYGNEEEMFGRIEDVALANNRVYILDSNRQDIRVFSISGEYIATIGGRGEGPGEFQMAKSMAVFQNKWLHVSNGYRIEVYDITHETPEIVSVSDHFIASRDLLDGYTSSRIYRSAADILVP